MEITVQLFAAARSLADADRIEVTLAPGATYGDLAAAIVAARPALAGLVASARFAADAAYTRPADPVDPAVEIALIPPVSGG